MSAVQYIAVAAVVIILVVLYVNYRKSAEPFDCCGSTPPLSNNLLRVNYFIWPYGSEQATAAVTAAAANDIQFSPNRSLYSDTDHLEPTN